MSVRKSTVHVSAQQGIRSSMEDAHVIDRNFLTSNADQVAMQLFAVFDGHGGAHVAKYLEQHYAPMLKRHLLPWKGLDCVENALRTSFIECNKEMRRMQRASEGIWSRGLEGGSTAVVALVVDHRWLFVANCGDAEAVLWTKDDKDEKGGIFCATVQHKPMSERARIVDAGGFVVFGRVGGTLAVSRSFGDFEYCNSESDEPYVIADPHISRREIASDSLLIVACDGLWDVFSHTDAVALAKQLQGTQNDVAAILVDVAIQQRRSQDNVTAIVVFVNEHAALPVGSGSRACVLCKRVLTRADFSKTQWRRGSEHCKCVSCINVVASFL